MAGEEEWMEKHRDNGR